tara:strand:+ start:335 stop:517 length:183 start_codon:yes stop_codon:yes gene_type:complete
MKTLNVINLGLSVGMTCSIPFIVAFGPSPLDQTQFAFIVTMAGAAPVLALASFLMLSESE